MSEDQQPTDVLCVRGFRAIMERRSEEYWHMAEPLCLGYFEEGRDYVITLLSVIPPDDVQGQISELMDIHSQDEFPKRKPSGMSKSVWLLFSTGNQCDTHSDGIAKVMLLASLLAWLECQDHLNRGDIGNCILTYGQALMLLGTSMARGVATMAKDSLQAVAKRGAEARHEENRSIKESVMRWLDENKDLTLHGDNTASEIAGKVAPIKWRTARDYITEWKKLRSAGKP